MTFDEIIERLILIVGFVAAIAVTGFLVAAIARVTDDPFQRLCVAHGGTHITHPNVEYCLQGGTTSLKAD